MKIKIGKGVKTSKNWKHYVSYMMQLEMRGALENVTLKEVARGLAEECQVEDGEIYLHSLNFSYVKRGEESTE